VDEEPLTVSAAHGAGRRDGKERRMDLVVYLAGEIHSDWRREIVEAAEREGLPIEFLSPVADHDASDGVGVEILGPEEKAFWKDHKGAKINAIRTRTALEQADVVVVKFGERYRQWNAAFDAGYAAALGTPLIVIHPPDLTHALKEIDGTAQAVAETSAQVVEILRYATVKA
jgi:YtoQ family protein